MQQTVVEASVEPYRKTPRRERFLREMNRVVPWAECGDGHRAGVSPG